MKSHSRTTLAIGLLSFGILIGFGLAAYEAFQAGDASHAIIPLLNCILAMILIVGLAWRRLEVPKDEPADHFLI